MRPDRDHIAAPDLPAEIAWVGGAPGSMPELTAAGPALVHFIDFAQLNSVRTLPYLAEWDKRYRELGLTTIGVQAPRFPFGADPAAVASGLERLDIRFPVAIDAGRQLWHAYGCEGWPSLFLWNRGGALAWFQFGEGEYRGTEEAIQAELREIDALRELPQPMGPLRPSDAPGEIVIAPTPEVFPGGSWEQPWVAGEDGEVLEMPYEAGGVHVTAEGRGEIAADLDDTVVGAIAIEAAGLYAVVEHAKHERHTLRLRPSRGLRVWSVSFAAGVP
jgi:hypothetical protein